MIALADALVTGGALSVFALDLPGQQHAITTAAGLHRER